MTATPEQIESLARELYLDKARQEAKGHGQNTVPWQDLGESFKVSVRRMARNKLESLE